MKRFSILLSLLLCLSIPLAACGQPQSSDSPSDPDEPASAGSENQNTALDPDEEASLLTCRIVDGAKDGDLLLAQLDGEAGEIYRLSVTDSSIPLTVDGQEAEWSQLADGMELTVSFDGMAAETFPASLGQIYWLEASTPPDGGYTDLCGLYLKVLDDLWNVDPGLNAGISIAGLDLSDAPGELTDSEKSAIAWRFGEAHGVEVVTGTFQELLEAGYLTQEEGAPLPYWEDGCLFSITDDDGTECFTLPTLRFNAQKWRSGTGAYYFDHCKAAWPQSGPWTDYTVGAQLIS